MDQRGFATETLFLIIVIGPPCLHHRGSGIRCWDSPHCLDLYNSSLASMNEFSDCSCLASVCLCVCACACMLGEHNRQAGAGGQFILPSPCPRAASQATAAPLQNPSPLTELGADLSSPPLGASSPPFHPQPGPPLLIPRLTMS